MMWIPIAFVHSCRSAVQTVIFQDCHNVWRACPLASNRFFWVSDLSCAESSNRSQESPAQQYSGAWVVVGELDGNGAVEIVSARNVDDNGKPLWEVGGEHFESVDVGKICADTDGLQMAVDIDHRPWGDGPVWAFDERGQVKTKIKTDDVRLHALLDWTGEGACLSWPRVNGQQHQRWTTALRAQPTLSIFS